MDHCGGVVAVVVAGHGVGCSAKWGSSFLQWLEWVPNLSFAGQLEHEAILDKLVADASLGDAAVDGDYC